MADIEIDYSKTPATVCYFVKENKVLLIEKGRNIGKGKLIGVGGRKETIDKTLEDTARREIREEIGIETIRSMKKTAEIEFVFPHNPKYSQKVTAFIIDSWEGEPHTTEEAKSVEWYDIDHLPFERMWHDNSIWVPPVLAGKLVVGHFVIGPDDRVTEYQLKEVSRF